MLAAGFDMLSPRASSLGAAVRIDADYFTRFFCSLRWIVVWRATPRE
jgi:hypothetical protein